MKNSTRGVPKTVTILDEFPIIVEFDNFIEIRDLDPQFTQKNFITRVAKAKRLKTTY